MRIRYQNHWERQEMVMGAEVWQDNVRGSEEMCGIRRKIDVNGSICKIIRAFSVAYWQFFDLAFAAPSHRRGESRKSLDIWMCPVRKICELLMFSTFELENKGVRLMSAWCPGCIRRIREEERTPSRFPWRYKVVATHLTPFCVWRLSQY